MIISKSNLQSYLTNWVRRFTRHHTTENNIRRFKIFICQPHATEGFIIKDIDTAPSIHEHLGELITSNLRRHHQCQMTRIINPGRMILSAPHKGLLRPTQVTRHCRFNSVKCPFMKLLIALVQASGEDMILSAIQLLRVALVTRLLLLLIALMIIATLIALITLIVMSTLITVEA